MNMIGLAALSAMLVTEAQEAVPAGEQVFQAVDATEQELQEKKDALSVKMETMLEIVEGICDGLSGVKDQATADEAAEVIRESQKRYNECLEGLDQEIQKDPDALLLMMDICEGDYGTREDQIIQRRDALLKELMEQDCYGSEELKSLLLPLEEESDIRNLPEMDDETAAQVKQEVMESARRLDSFLSGVVDASSADDAARKIRELTDQMEALREKIASYSHLPWSDGDFSEGWGDIIDSIEKKMADLQENDYFGSESLKEALDAIFGI